MSASVRNGDANHNHHNKALVVAIRNHQLDEVRNLLEHDLDKIDINDYIDDDSRRTPLSVACGVDDVRIVALLIEYGANPNHGQKIVEINGECYDSNDDAPIWFLMLSCRATNDVLSKLLRCGANPNVIRPSIGWSLLHCLCYDDTYEIIDYLVRKGVNPKQLCRYTGLPEYQIRIGQSRFDDMHVSRLRLLLEYGTDPNLISRWGMPPLYLAIHRARGEFRMDVIRLMMQYGADITIPLSMTPPLYVDCDNCIIGDTVLHAAIRLRDVEAVRVMTEDQAITTFWWLRNENDDTVYDLAVQLEAAPIIEYFDTKLRQQCYAYLRRHWIPKSSFVGRRG